MNSNGKQTTDTTDMVKGGLPPWMAKMRAAAQAAVSEADVTEMVKAQVELAKKGDQKALDFVFNNVLGGSQLKGATFNQNNYYETKDRDPAPSELPRPTYQPSRKALG